LDSRDQSWAFSDTPVRPLDQPSPERRMADARRGMAARVKRRTRSFDDRLQAAITANGRTSIPNGDFDARSGYDDRDNRDGFDGNGGFGPDL
jgi:hypothetical protein